jgi:hypothetical protein
MFEANVTTTEINDAWGQWISGLADWKWFVTLTFRDPTHRHGSNWTKPGWRQAKQAWAQFTDFIMRDPAQGRWVRCFEVHKWRGTPHIHGLVSGVNPEVDIRQARDWAYHRYGIARITQYDPNLGAAWYIAKYVNSDTFNIEFGGDFPSRTGGKEANHTQ